MVIKLILLLNVWLYNFMLIGCFDINGNYDKKIKEKLLFKL